MDSPHACHFEDLDEPLASAVFLDPQVQAQLRQWFDRIEREVIPVWTTRHRRKQWPPFNPRGPWDPDQAELEARPVSWWEEPESSGAPPKNRENARWDPPLPPRPGAQRRVQACYLCGRIELTYPGDWHFEGTCRSVAIARWALEVGGAHLQTTPPGTGSRRDEEELANANLSLGLLAAHAGLYPEAGVRLGAAVLHAEATGEREQAAWLRLRAGEVAASGGETVEARRFLDDALRYFERQTSSVSLHPIPTDAMAAAMTRCHRGLAASWREADPGRAEEHLWKAISVAMECPEGIVRHDAALVGACYEDLGDLLASTSPDRAQVEFVFRQATVEFVRDEDRSSSARCRQRVADIAVDDRPDAAVALYTRAAIDHSEVGHEAAARACHDALVRIANDTGVPIPARERAHRAAESVVPLLRSKPPREEQRAGK